jgi:hypothetical protein
VSLQAGTKYDIRLEYARNSVQPALLKLEWQSARRTKQVVPNAALFSSGSNAQNTINNILKVENFAKLNLTLTVNATLSSLQAGGKTVLYALLPDNKGFILSGLEADKVSFLYSYQQSGQVGTFSDVLENRSTTLENVSNLINSDGTFTYQQRQVIAQKLVETISKGTMAITAVSTGNTVGARTQVLDYIIPCDAWLPPIPVNCDVYECKRKSEDHRDAVCKTAYGAGEVIASFIPNPATAGSTAAKIWDAGKTFAGGAAPLDLFPAFQIPGLFNDLQECLKRNKNVCLISVTITPPSINERRVVGSIGVVSVTITNDATSASSAFGGYLVVSAQQLSGFGPIRLKPAESSLMSVTYICPNEPAVLEGVIDAGSNAMSSNIGIPLKVLVKVECYRNPKLKANPNPLEIVAPINVSTSTPGKIEVRNDGGSDLKIFESEMAVFYFPDSPAGADLSLPVSLRGEVIKPGESKNIEVAGKCGSTPGKLQGTITISSNDPSSPTTVGVILKCRQVETIFFALLRQRGGCSGNPGGPYESNSTWWSTLVVYSDRSASGVNESIDLPKKEAKWDGCQNFTRDYDTTQRLDEKDILNPSTIISTARNWEMYAKPEYKLINPRWGTVSGITGYIAEVVKTSP